MLPAAPLQGVMAEAEKCPAAGSKDRLWTRFPARLHEPHDESRYRDDIDRTENR